MGLRFKDDPERLDYFVSCVRGTGNIKESAKKTGMSEWTAYRLMREDENLQSRVKHARVQYLKEMAGEMQKHAPEAVETLLEIMRNPKSTPSSRVNAASRILDYSLEFGENADVEGRISELQDDIALAEQLTGKDN